jgi:hypothetical protein
MVVLASVTACVLISSSMFAPLGLNWTYLIKIIAVCQLEHYSFVNA